MSTFVTVGTAPTVDVSVVVGPFRSRQRAIDAAGAMDALGYITEICECQALDDLEPLDWSDGG